MHKFFIIIVLFGSLPTWGQSTNFGSSNDWRRTKNELIIGLGATNFLGDLGGLDQEGTDYSPVDLEWAMTRPMAYIGYRSRLSKVFAYRAELAWGILRGDDQLTTEPYRNYRNIHFRSHFLELDQLFEIGFSREKVGHRYKIKGAHGYKNLSAYFYVFAGVGVMAFNPKAKVNGSWRALQPLGTEGQVVTDTLKKYSRFTYTIPVGGGVRFLLGKRINIGLEVAYRKAGSDYLDDVSGDYYDNNLILAVQGPDAAQAADPSDGSNHNWTIAGEQRGDPNQKDAVLSANISINYNLTGFNSMKPPKRPMGRQYKRRRRYKASF